MDTVNIDFIAKKAGCSPATVSRVLNKSKRVSSELEQRVYDVIAKYNYHPNAMARGLATKRSRLIGIIFPEQMNQYHLYLLQCLNTRITEAGYNVSMAFAKEGYENFIRTYERLQEQNAELVFCAKEISRKEEELFRSRSHQTCFFDANNELWEDHWAEVNEKAIYEATSYLIGLGHRVIGGIFAEDERQTGFVAARKRGFQMALKKYGVPYIDDIVLDNVSTMREAYKRVGSIMHSASKPTAIVCYSDETAIGAMMYLMQHGIKIPEDISVIGLDGIPLGDCMMPRLTTMAFPMDAFVDALVRAITEILELPKKEACEEEKETTEKRKSRHYGLKGFQLLEKGSCAERKQN